MMRALLRTVSPGGVRGRLTVLIYHRVLAESDELLPDEPDAIRFESEMRWVRSWCTVLPLPEAVDRLASDDLPPCAAAISFDDGYADNHNVALPILRRLGLPATFFTCTGFLDGGRMWNDTVIEAFRSYRGSELDLTRVGLARFATQTVADKRRSIANVLQAIKYREPSERDELVLTIVEEAGSRPSNGLMMTKSQVRALHQAGMTIGGHTIDHPILRAVSQRRAEQQIDSGKKQLESIIGQRIRLFAYPNGVPGLDYAAEHVALVKRLGFDAAFSTARGVASRAMDPFQLPRFRPWDRARVRYGLRLWRNAMNASPSRA